MGVYGLASAVALSLGPYLGGELVRRVGFTATFLTATAIESAALMADGAARDVPAVAAATVPDHRDPGARHPALDRAARRAARRP
jgi:hypothetical protein